MVNQRNAYILALIAILFWSTMSSAFKITLGYIDFESLLFLAVVTGTIALFFIILLRKDLNLKDQFTIQHIRKSAVMAFFNPFLYYLVLLKGYSLLEAQVAGILNYTWPIMLVIFSVIFLRQKIPWYSFLALFISFMGIIIISTDGKPFSMDIKEPFGVFLTLLSSVFWAAYWILNLKDKNRKSEEKIFMNLLIGSVYIAIYLWFSGISFQFDAWQIVVGTVYIGLFEMSITFVIWLKALEFSSNTAKVSNLVYLSPFIALLWINLTLGEEIHLSSLFGLAFLILGILIQQFLSSRSKSS